MLRPENVPAAIVETLGDVLAWLDEPGKLEEIARAVEGAAAAAADPNKAGVLWAYAAVARELLGEMEAEP